MQAKAAAAAAAAVPTTATYYIVYSSGDGRIRYENRIDRIYEQAMRRETKKKNLAMTIDDHDYDVTIAACCRVSNDCVFVVRLAIAVRHTHACRIRRKRFSTPSNIYTGFHYEKCLARVLLLHLYLTLAILASQHQQPQLKQLEMDKHLFVYCVFAFTIHAWMYDKLCYYASKRIWFNRNDSTNHTNTACCISDIVEWDAL